MIDRIRHSNILDVRSFRGADCDTDRCLVVVKLKESLAVCKQAAQKFEGERFNLRKLNDLGFKEKYQIEIRMRFVAVENLNVDETLIGLGKTLKRKSKPQIKKA